MSLDFKQRCAPWTDWWNSVQKSGGWTVILALTAVAAPASGMCVDKLPVTRKAATVVQFMFNAKSDTGPSFGQSAIRVMSAHRVF